MKSVLVVEDEAAVADVLLRGLGAEGYRVALARDGREALDAAAAERFDVILLDIMLPGGMDGRDVCQAIRARRDATRRRC
jgi:CheY-like chemotaxis protein